MEAVSGVLSGSLDAGQNAAHPKAQPERHLTLERYLCRAVRL